MRALITGGTGFVGKYVVKELVKRGTEVTLLTSDYTYTQCEEPMVKVVYTDYTYEDLIVSLSDATYDIFYHLGWAGVGGKDKNDIPLQIGNIQVAVDMIRLSKAVGCSVFVAAGTVAEYVFCKGVIDFSMKQTPNDVYGATKVAVHYLLEAIAKQVKQDMIWAVLPSTFGEGRKEDNIITYTITTLLGGGMSSIWKFRTNVGFSICYRGGKSPCGNRREGETQYNLWDREWGIQTTKGLYMYNQRYDRS